MFNAAINLLEFFDRFVVFESVHNCSATDEANSRGTQARKETDTIRTGTSISKGSANVLDALDPRVMSQSCANKTPSSITKIVPSEAAD